MTKKQWFKVGIVGLLAALVVVVILLNSQKVTVHLLMAKTEMPLWVLLLVALLAGAAINWAVSYVLRHRR